MVPHTKAEFDGGGDGGGGNGGGGEGGGDGGAMAGAAVRVGMVMVEMAEAMKTFGLAVLMAVLTAVEATM